MNSVEQNNDTQKKCNKCFLVLLKLTAREKYYPYCG